MKTWDDLIVDKDILDWDSMLQATNGQISRFKYLQLKSWWATKKGDNYNDWDFESQAEAYKPVKKEVTIWY